MLVNGIKKNNGSSIFFETKQIGQYNFKFNLQVVSFSCNISFILLSWYGKLWRKKSLCFSFVAVVVKTSKFSALIIQCSELTCYKDFAKETCFTATYIYLMFFKFVCTMLGTAGLPLKFFFYCFSFDKTLCELLPK